MKHLMGDLLRLGTGKKFLINYLKLFENSLGYECSLFKFSVVLESP